MNYNILIETISEIVNNDSIYKKGLTLVYAVDEHLHKRLDEHFHYKTKAEEDNDNDEFEHTDDFEVEIGGIIIKFIKNEGK
jgi:hypothetical protein